MSYYHAVSNPGKMDVIYVDQESFTDQGESSSDLLLTQDQQINKEFKAHLRRNFQSKWKNASGVEVVGLNPRVKKRKNVPLPKTHPWLPKKYQNKLIHRYLDNNCCECVHSGQDIIPQTFRLAVNTNYEGHTNLIHIDAEFDSLNDQNKNLNLEDKMTTIATFGSRLSNIHCGPCCLNVSTVHKEKTLPFSTKLHKLCSESALPFQTILKKNDSLMDSHLESSAEDWRCSKKYSPKSKVLEKRRFWQVIGSNGSALPIGMLKAYNNQEKTQVWVRVDSDFDIDDLCEKPVINNSSLKGNLMNQMKNKTLQEPTNSAEDSKNTVNVQFHDYKYGTHVGQLDTNNVFIDGTSSILLASPNPFLSDSPLAPIGRMTTREQFPQCDSHESGQGESILSTSALRAVKENPHNNESRHNLYHKLELSAFDPLYKEIRSEQASFSQHNVLIGSSSRTVKGKETPDLVNIPEMSQEHNLIDLILDPSYGVTKSEQTLSSLERGLSESTSKTNKEMETSDLINIQVMPQQCSLKNMILNPLYGVNKSEQTLCSQDSDLSESPLQTNKGTETSDLINIQEMSHDCILTDLNCLKHFSSTNKDLLSKNGTQSARDLYVYDKQIKIIKPSSRRPPSPALRFATCKSPNTFPPPAMASPFWNSLCNNTSPCRKPEEPALIHLVESDDAPDNQQADSCLNSFSKSRASVCTSCNRPLFAQIPIKAVCPYCNQDYSLPVSQCTRSITNVDASSVPTKSSTIQQSSCGFSKSNGNVHITPTAIEGACNCPNPGLHKLIVDSNNVKSNDTNDYSHSFKRKFAQSSDCQNSELHQLTLEKIKMASNKETQTDTPMSLCINESSICQKHNIQYFDPEKCKMVLTEATESFSNLHIRCGSSTSLIFQREPNQTSYNDTHGLKCQKSELHQLVPEIMTMAPNKQAQNVTPTSPHTDESIICQNPNIQYSATPENCKVVLPETTQSLLQSSFLPKEGSCCSISNQAPFKPMISKQSSLLNNPNLHVVLPLTSSNSLNDKPSRGEKLCSKEHSTGQSDIGTQTDMHKPGFHQYSTQISALTSTEKQNKKSSHELPTIMSSSNEKHSHCQSLITNLFTSSNFDYNEEEIFSDSSLANEEQDLSTENYYAHKNQFTGQIQQMESSPISLTTLKGDGSVYYRDQMKSDREPCSFKKCKNYKKPSQSCCSKDPLPKTVQNLHCSLKQKITPIAPKQSVLSPTCDQLQKKVVMPMCNECLKVTKQLKKTKQMPTKLQTQCDCAKPTTAFPIQITTKKDLKCVNCKYLPNMEPKKDDQITYPHLEKLNQTNEATYLSHKLPTKVVSKNKCLQSTIVPPINEANICKCSTYNSKKLQLPSQINHDLQPQSIDNEPSIAAQSKESVCFATTPRTFISSDTNKYLEGSSTETSTPYTSACEVLEFGNQQSPDDDKIPTIQQQVSEPNLITQTRKSIRCIYEAGKLKRPSSTNKL